MWIIQLVGRTSSKNIFCTVGIMAETLLYSLKVSTNAINSEIDSLEPRVASVEAGLVAANAAIVVADEKAVAAQGRADDAHDLAEEAAASASAAGSAVASLETSVNTSIGTINNDLETKTTQISFLNAGNKVKISYYSPRGIGSVDMSDFFSGKLWLVSQGGTASLQTSAPDGTVLRFLNVASAGNSSDDVELLYQGVSVVKFSPKETVAVMFSTADNKWYAMTGI